jgi:hypothetical protein
LARGCWNAAQVLAASESHLLARSNVLADWFKMDDAEIDQLRDGKVIAGDVAAASIAAE